MEARNGILGGVFSLLVQWECSTGELILKKHSGWFPSPYIKRFGGYLALLRRYLHWSPLVLLSSQATRPELMVNILFNPLV